jgi:hypothetical protein
LSANTQYKLSVLFDIESGDVTIYWDEGTSLYLSSDILNVSQISLRNMGNATADLRYVLDDVSLIAGVPEFFRPPVSLPGVTAAELNDHVVLESSERTVAFVGLKDSDQDGTMQGALDNDELLLSLLGSATTNENDSLTVGFESPISGLFTLEMEFTAPAAMNQEWNLQIGLEDGEESGTRMAFRYSYLFLRNDTNTRWLQIKNSITPGATHKLSVVIDTNARTADYYIDEQLTARSGEATSLNQLRVVRFTNLGNAASDLEYRIDNLRVVAGDVFDDDQSELSAGLVDAAFATHILPPSSSNPAVAVVDQRLSRVFTVAQRSARRLMSDVTSDDSRQSVDIAVSSDRAESKFEQQADELFSAIGRGLQ